MVSLSVIYFFDSTAEGEIYNKQVAMLSLSTTPRGNASKGSLLAVHSSIMDGVKVVFTSWSWFLNSIFLVSIN